MSKQVSHTQTPWRIGDAGRTVFGPTNGNPSPETVAHTNRANAAFIVIACNNHDALVGALSNALDAWYVHASNDERSGKYGLPTWVVNARAALASARQTQGEAK